MLRIMTMLLTFVLAFALPVLAADAPIGEAVNQFLVNVIFPIVAAFLTGLVAMLLRKMQKRYGLEVDARTEAMILEKVRQGVAYAEEKASTYVKNNVKTITGREKLDVAIGYVCMHAPEVSPARAEQLVESMLGRTPGVGASGETAVQ